MVQALGTALANRPAARALAAWKGGYQILTYHRVLPAWDPLAIAPVAAADFTRQMKLLRDCYRVVPLEALMAELDAGKLRPGTVCVTLDDGYRDNAEMALPILKAYGIPATIFLATDFIGGGGSLWYDKVLQAFRQTARPDFALPAAGMARQSLRDLPGRFHPSHAVLEWLKDSPPAEREAKMRLVYQALDLAGEPRCDLMLDWDQVRAMRGQGISFGAHTCSHPILSTLGPEANEAEIAGSKAAIDTFTKAAHLFVRAENGGETVIESDLVQF